ncbi:MAG: hypothetical protein HY830_03200 [Actinobacteria bacterium]|nr:hypothetical protein [Actinomycetota bacterium]
MGRPPGSFIVSAVFLGLFAARAWGPAPALAVVQGLLCVVMVLGAVAVRAGRVGAWVALAAAAVTVVVGATVWTLTGLWVPGTIAAAWATVAAFGAVSASRAVRGAGTVRGGRTAPAMGPVPVPGGRRSGDQDPLGAPWPHPAQRVPDHLAPPMPTPMSAPVSAPGSAPVPLPAPVPVAAPAFASSTALGAAPQFATTAPRATLSSLRATSVSSLQGFGSPGAGASAPDGPARFGSGPSAGPGRTGLPAPAGAHAPGVLAAGDRVWGSPAAPGSAAQVLPGARGGRRRFGRTGGAAAPVPGQRLPGSAHAAATPAPVATDAPAPGGTPRLDTAPPVPLEPLTRRPGDPQVGPALLGPARSRIRELEEPLLTSWLAALAAGERGEPAAPLSPGQVAVLAAACEDPAVSARLLDAVTTPVAHADRAARAARAAALLHLVARSTSGTQAQAAVLRTLDSVHTS